MRVSSTSLLALLPLGGWGTWAQVAPDPGPCGEGDHGCLEARAAALAAAGETTAAGAVCRAFAEEKLQQDCFFANSERVPGGADLDSRAMPLYGGAGSFAPECQGHLLLRMRTHSPGPLDLPRLRQESMDIAAFWQRRSPAYWLTAVDLYWSVTAAHTLGSQRPFPRQAFDALPVEIHPHIRSALALRVTDEPDPLQAARQVLAGGGDDLPAVTPLNAPQLSCQRLLRDNRPQDPPLRRIFFCGVRGGQRPVHADSDIDLQLAVLMASAMHRPPRIDVLQAAQQSVVAEVRWLAGRLLE